MKRIWIMAAGGLLIVNLAVRADDEPRIPPPDNPLEAAPEHPRSGSRLGRGPEAGPPVEASPREGSSGRWGRATERWMEGLKERDPAEYDRLQKLRADNPQAFRDELRGRLMEARKRLVGPGDGGRPMPGEGDRQPAIVPRDFPLPLSPEGRAEWQQAEERLRSLAREWRETSDASGKQEKAKEIRALLSRLFELRDREQQAYLKAMEARLSEVRARWDERRAKREEHIERRLQQILSPREMKPEEPAPHPPPPAPPESA